MRLWNWKFGTALGLVALFVFFSVPLGLATDPLTGDPAALWSKPMENGPASFVFLLLVIYVISHAGGWVLGKFRDRGKPQVEEEPKGRRGRAKAPKGHA